MPRRRNSEGRRGPKGQCSIREKRNKRKNGTTHTSYELRYIIGRDAAGIELRKSESFNSKKDAEVRRAEVAAILLRAKSENWSYEKRLEMLFPDKFEPVAKLSHETEAAPVANTNIQSDVKTYFTVDRWFEKWLSTCVRGTESTKNKYHDDYNRYISKVIGGRDISEVLPIDIQEMVNAWQNEECAIKKPLSNKYVWDIHSMLKSCFKMAVVNKIITSNPCECTILTKDTKTEKKEKKIKINLNEIVEILNILSRAPHARFYLFSAFFGLRVMENLGLTINDIDMEQKVIHLKYQLRRDINEVPDKRYGETKHFKRLKDKDPRDIYFDDQIATLLKEQIAHERLKKARLGDKWPTDDLERGDLLFSNDDGYYLSYSTIRDCFGRRVKKINKNLRVHDLRHIYVTIAYISKVPIEIVAQHVGHEDAKLTDNVYLAIPDEIYRKSAAEVGHTIAGLMSQIASNRDNKNDNFRLDLSGLK